MHYRGVRKRREKGLKKIFEEIIAKNFLNVEKEIVNQVQEAQRVPGRIIKEEHTETVIKLKKIKGRDKILKAKGKTANNIQGTPIRLSTDFSIKTLQA